MKSDKVNKRRTQFFWNKFKFFGFKKAFRISLNILGVNFFSVDLILRKKTNSETVAWIDFLAWPSIT